MSVPVLLNFLHFDANFHASVTLLNLFGFS